MNHRIYRSVSEGKRNDPSHDERWKGEDKGLITCWEVGRSKRDSEPDLVSKAENGELPILPWKGGTKEALKNNKKFGSLNYLALWQGLRGEDLDIHLNEELTLVCSKTKMHVTFTPDISKLSLP